MAVEKPRVLFLCTDNSTRSQMAELLLRQHGGNRFEVSSAGLTPADVHPLTREVMREVGIEASELRARRISEFLGKVSIRYAIIVCEQSEPGPRIFPFAVETLYWPCEDPTGAPGSPDERLARFRAVRDQIAERIRRFVAEPEWESREAERAPG